MTEEEAKKKKCPMKAHISQVAYDANFTWNCIGSKCMAWRWQIDVTNGDFDKEIGYCGMAGREQIFFYDHHGDNMAVPTIHIPTPGPQLDTHKWVRENVYERPLFDFGWLKRIFRRKK